jgi:type IV pilus assembly protein PilV
MKTLHTLRPRGRQTGMTLIEVLVAILIFSFGLIGLVGLQARAMQFSTSAEDTGRAALLANEIAASIAMQTSTVVQPVVISVSASAAEAWQARAANMQAGGLPNGTATIAASGNSATITITWQPPSAASGAANAINRFVTSVVIP